jgi:hypothetical protein
LTSKHPASAALAELGPGRSGAKRWAPPDELVDDIVGARRAGASFDCIARTLSLNGVQVSMNAVGRWLKDRGVD